MCDDEGERVNRKIVWDRKDAHKNINKWDWDKNYGRRAFRAARCNYLPPTSYLAHPNIKGEYITKAEDIHELFKEAWSKVYRVHPSECDIWEKFHSEYAANIPRAEYQDSPYSADEFAQQLEKMKDTAAGFDGWTRKALLLMP